MSLQSSSSLASVSFFRRSRRHTAAARQNGSQATSWVFSSPSVSLTGLPDSGAVDLSVCPSAPAAAPPTAQISTLTLRNFSPNSPSRTAAHLPSAAASVGPDTSSAAAPGAAGVADVPARTASSAAADAAHSPVVTSAAPRRSSPASRAAVAGCAPSAAASVPSLADRAAGAEAAARKGSRAATRATLGWPSSPRSPARAVLLADPVTVYFPAFAAWLSDLPPRAACKLLLHAVLHSSSTDASSRGCGSLPVAAAAQQLLQQPQPVAHEEASFREEEQLLQLPVDLPKQQQPPLFEFPGQNTAAAAAATRLVRVQQPTAAPAWPTPEESVDSFHARVWRNSSRRQLLQHDGEKTADLSLQPVALNSACTAPQVHQQRRGRTSLLQQDTSLQQRATSQSNSCNRAKPLRGTAEERHARRRQQQPGAAARSRGLSAAQLMVPAGLQQPIQQKAAFLTHQRPRVTRYALRQQQEDEEENCTGFCLQQQPNTTAQQHQEQPSARAFSEEQKSHEHHVSRQLQQQTQQQAQHRTQQQAQQRTQQQFLQESQVQALPQLRHRHQQQQTLRHVHDQQQSQQVEQQEQKQRREQLRRDQQDEDRQQRRRTDVTVGVDDGSQQRLPQVAAAEARVRCPHRGSRKQQRRDGGTRGEQHTGSVKQQEQQALAVPDEPHRKGGGFSRQTRRLLQQLLLEKIEEQYLLFDLLLTEGVFLLEPQQPPPWPPPPPAAAVAIAALLVLRLAEPAAAAEADCAPVTAHTAAATGRRGAAGGARVQGCGALAGDVLAESRGFPQQAAEIVSRLCPCTIPRAAAEAPAAAAAAAAAEVAAIRATSAESRLQWARASSAAAAASLFTKAAPPGAAERTRTTEAAGVPAGAHTAADRTYSAVVPVPISASAEGVPATQPPYPGAAAATMYAAEHQKFSILARYEKAKELPAEWGARTGQAQRCCVDLPPSVLQVLLRGYFSLDAAVLLRLLLLPSSHQQLLVGNASSCCWRGGVAAATKSPDRYGRGAAPGSSSGVRAFFAVSQMLARFTGRRRKVKRVSLEMSLCCDIAAATACGGVAVVQRQMENLQRVRRYIAAGALQQQLQPRRSFLRKIRGIFPAAATTDAAPAAAQPRGPALLCAAVPGLPPLTAAPSLGAGAGVDPPAEHFSEGLREDPAVLEQQSAVEPPCCLFCTQLPPCVSVAVAVQLLLPAFLGSRLGFLYWRICFVLQHNLLLPPVLQAADGRSSGATPVDRVGRTAAATALRGPSRSATGIDYAADCEGTGTGDKFSAARKHTEGAEGKEGSPTGTTEAAPHGGATAATAEKMGSRQDTHGRHGWHLKSSRSSLRKGKSRTERTSSMPVKESSRVPGSEQGITSYTWCCPPLCCFRCVDRLLLRLLQLLYGNSRSLRVHNRQAVSSTRQEPTLPPTQKRAARLGRNEDAAARGGGEARGAEGGEGTGKAEAWGEITAAGEVVAPGRRTTAAAEEEAGGLVVTRGEVRAVGTLPAATGFTEGSVGVSTKAESEHRERQESMTATAKREARETAAAAAAAATLRLPQWCTLGSTAIKARCDSLGGCVAASRTTVRRSLVASTAFSKKGDTSSIAGGEKIKIFSQGSLHLLQQHVQFHMRRLQELAEERRSIGQPTQVYSCLENSVPLFPPPAAAGTSTYCCQLSKNMSATAADLGAPAAARAPKSDPRNTLATTASSRVPGALHTSGNPSTSFRGGLSLGIGASSVSAGDFVNSENPAAAAARRSSPVSASACPSSKIFRVDNAVTAAVPQPAVSSTVSIAKNTSIIHATEKRETATGLEAYLRKHSTAEREGPLRSRNGFGGAAANGVQSVCDAWRTETEKLQIDASAAFRNFYALLCCFSSATNFGSCLLHAWNLAALLGSPRDVASATHCCCCSCCCSTAEYSSCSRTTVGSSAATQEDEQHATATRTIKTTKHGLSSSLDRKGDRNHPSFDKQRLTSSLDMLLSPPREEDLEAALGRTAGGGSFLPHPASADGARLHEEKDGAAAVYTEGCSREQQPQQHYTVRSVCQQREEDTEHQDEWWPEQQQPQQWVVDADERRRRLHPELQQQREAEYLQQQSVHKRVQLQQRKAICQHQQHESEPQLPHKRQEYFPQQADVAGEEQLQQRQQRSFDYWRRKREQLRLYFAACETAFLELFASGSGRRSPRQGKLGRVADISPDRRHSESDRRSLMHPEVCYDFRWSQSNDTNTSSASESGFSSRSPNNEDRNHSNSSRRGRNSKKKDYNGRQKHRNHTSCSDTVVGREGGRRERGLIRRTDKKGRPNLSLANERGSSRKSSSYAASSNRGANAKARKLIRHCYSFALSLIDHPLQHCTRCGDRCAGSTVKTTAESSAYEQRFCGGQARSSDRRGSTRGRHSSEYKPQESLAM